MLNRREIARRQARVLLKPVSTQVVDIAKCPSRSFLGSDRPRKGFLGSDPAFALRCAGRGRQLAGFGCGRSERRVAAAGLIDERSELSGQRRVDRAIIHRPNDLEARIDGFGGSRQQRWRRAARGAGTEQQYRSEDDGFAHQGQAIQVNGVAERIRTWVLPAVFDPSPPLRLQVDYRLKSTWDWGGPAYNAKVEPAVLALFIATILVMEGVAYAAHRWVMHGPGWFLHESHHRDRIGLFELNDLYAVFFALPSVVLLLGGVRLGWGSWAVAVGAGIAAYGAIYFGFHDVIVHRRLSHRYVPRWGYMKRIVQAHRLHHATTSKRGAVSFGFIWAPSPEILKRQLARSQDAEIREPRAQR